MKTRLAKLIALFLAALLCLMSCTSDSGMTETADTHDITQTPIQENGSIDYGTINLSAFSDTISDAEQIILTNSYTFLPLADPGDGWYFNEQKIEFHDGRICINIEQKENLSILAQQVAYLTVDGTISHTVPYVYPTVDYYQDETLMEGVRGSYMIDENTFLFTSYTNIYNYSPERIDELESGYLMLCDTAGNVLSDTMIPGTGINSRILRLHDGRIAVIGGESICIFDETLNLTAQIGDGSKTTLFVSPRGELFAEGTYLGSYYRLDPDAYTCQAETYYNAPKNIMGVSRMFFSPTDSAYEVYFTNPDGFWGYNGGDTEADLLCHWSNSGQVYANLTVLGVLDENHILVSVKDPFSNENQIGWLFCDPTQTAAKKTPIRLGIVDNLRKWGTLGTMDHILKNAVNQFNAQNSEYYVEIIDYSNNKDEIGDIPKEFSEAMLSGTAADIIVSSRYQHDGMKIYTTKNAFLDLRDAFGDILLPSVVSTYADDNGAMVSLPINMYLSMLVTDTGILSDDENLTLDTMYNLSAQAQDAGVMVFNTYTTVDGAYNLKDKLLSAALPSFADPSSGTCTYDSAEFAQFLQFYEALPRNSESEYYISYAYGDYELGPAALDEALQNGDIAFLDFPFNNMEGYIRLKQLYGDTAFALHGYPTKDGESIRFRSDIDLHINASSKVQRGAAEFLAYLLSDKIQMYQSNFVLPVTVSSIEALLLTEFTFVLSTMSRLDLYYDEATIKAVYPEAVRLSYSEEDIAVLRQLFYETEFSSEMDSTMTSIFEEEYLAYLKGIRSMEEMQKILQSRLWIYINE